jgi:dynein intermediate chain 2
LTRTSERCIRQNNEIDLFEEYFAAENAEAMADDLFTKTLMIFKDPN